MTGSQESDVKSTPQSTVMADRDDLQEQDRTPVDDQYAEEDALSPAMVGGSTALGELDPALASDDDDNDADEQQPMDDSVIEMEEVDKDLLERAVTPFDDGHEAACTGSDGDSTPEPSWRPVAETDSPATPSDQPSIQVSRALQDQTYLHKRAKEVRPDTYLAEERYWVGVLDPKLQPKDIRQEKHLIWFKASQGNTVRTIHEFYKNATALPVQIMIEGQVPPMTDLMREWDLFNDRIVIFRAVMEEEIIEID